VTPEAKVRAGAWRDPTAGRIAFGDYVNRWYAGLRTSDLFGVNYSQCGSVRSDPRSNPPAQVG
jgi:hypothetical protein